MDLDAIRRANRAGDGRPANSFGNSSTASRHGADVFSAGANHQTQVPSSKPRASNFPFGVIIILIVLVALVLAVGLMVNSNSRPGDNGASQRTPSISAPSGPARAPVGKWVLVLESLPQARTTLKEANAQARRLSTEQRSVLVIDSSATPGLNSGYWALVLLPFETRVQAASACADMGREVGGSCYPRHIE